MVANWHFGAVLKIVSTVCLNSLKTLVMFTKVHACHVHAKPNRCRLLSDTLVTTDPNRCGVSNKLVSIIPQSLRGK